METVDQIKKLEEIERKVLKFGNSEKEVIVMEKKI